MENCSISTTKVLVNYTIVNHNVHNPNDDQLPSVFDKDFDQLSHYINATGRLCDRLLMCEGQTERLSTVVAAYEEYKNFREQTEQWNKSPSRSRFSSFTSMY